MGVTSTEHGSEPPLDEMERRPAVHLERLAAMACEDEDRMVERRVSAKVIGRSLRRSRSQSPPGSDPRVIARARRTPESRQRTRPVASRLLAVATGGLHKGSIPLDGRAWIRASSAAFQSWASVRWRDG